MMPLNAAKRKKHSRLDTLIAGFLDHDFCGIISIYAYLPELDCIQNLQSVIATGSTNYQTALS
jgi:hypothetical protein